MTDDNPNAPARVTALDVDFEAGKLTRLWLADIAFDKGIVDLEPLGAEEMKLLVDHARQVQRAAGLEGDQLSWSGKVSDLDDEARRSLAEIASLTYALVQIE